MSAGYSKLLAAEGAGGEERILRSLSLSLSAVKVRKSVRQHPGKFFALGSDCTENRGLLVAQALLELTAKLVQQARCMAFC